MALEPHPLGRVSCVREPRPYVLSFKLRADSFEKLHINVFVAKTQSHNLLIPYVPFCGRTVGVRRPIPKRKQEPSHDSEVAYSAQQTGALRGRSTGAD